MSIKPHPLLVKSYYKLISLDKVRFIVVGAIGFVVNYLSLTLFYHILKLPIVLSQTVSAELAVIATFLGNNFWTFTHHHHISMKNKFIKFNMSALAGLFVNTVIVSVLVHYAHMNYGIALLIGSAAALIWNYTLYKRFVFKTHIVPTDEEDLIT